MPKKQAGMVYYEGEQSIVAEFYKGIDLNQIVEYGAFAVSKESKLDTG